mmetsp:Transcript_3010/g.8791  ORF Transcript_3010/g.8791 Transcript_3010/m.8791 type:complete len:446 (+) Transcript_3010:172-1509(+)
MAFWSAASAPPPCAVQSSSFADHFHTGLRHQGPVSRKSLPTSQALGRWSNGHWRNCKAAALLRFSEEEIQVDEWIGDLGIMEITRVPSALAAVLRQKGLGQAVDNSVSDQGLLAKLYRGKVVRGDLMGTKVLLKAYPVETSSDASEMADNELLAHDRLQANMRFLDCDLITKALGSFSPRAGPHAGEKWLVLRDYQSISAAQYAQTAAAASEKAMGMKDPQQVLAGRRAFVREVIRQAMQGLQYLHQNMRLHQSLGPASLLLSTSDEKRWQQLRVRIADLGLSVDASDSALYGGATLAEIWDNNTYIAEHGDRRKLDPPNKMKAALWNRARAASAFTAEDKCLFGIADDISAAGFLVAYLAFVPFCPPEAVDGPTLQRLLEGPFRGDPEGLQEYCSQDDRWQEAVSFLNEADGAGWHLITTMVDPQWRLRPTAEQCLKHPWLAIK